MATANRHPTHRETAEQFHSDADPKHTDMHRNTKSKPTSAPAKRRNPSNARPATKAASPQRRDPGSKRGVGPRQGPWPKRGSHPKLTARVQASPGPDPQPPKAQAGQQGPAQPKAQARPHEPSTFIFIPKSRFRLPTSRPKNWNVTLGLLPPAPTKPIARLELCLRRRPNRLLDWTCPPAPTTCFFDFDLGARPDFYSTVKE